MSALQTKPPAVPEVADSLLSNKTSPRYRRLAWTAVLILFYGSVVNYLDRSVLGVLKPVIQRDLSLTNTDYGLAVNSFLVTYTIFYILGGRLADWLGCRIMVSINAVLWSSACVLHSLTRGLAGLCLFRGLLGIGEGGFYPAAVRGISEWFGPESRAKAMGVLLCGLGVGTLVTPPTVAWITIHYSWRASFLLTGALGLLLLPPWMFLQRRLGPRPAIPSAKARPSVGQTPHFEVIRNRKYLGLVIARAVTDVVWLFYLFWMPGYFQEVRNFTLAQVARLMWIPFFCCDVGALVGAWASSELVRRGTGVDRARKTVLLASASLGTLGALTPGIANSYVALAIVSVVCFAQLSWTSNIHTSLTEVAPPDQVAVLYGISGAAGNGLGALAQPFIGRMVDTHGYGPAFLASGATYIVAMAFVFYSGKIEPIERTMDDEP